MTEVRMKELHELVRDHLRATFEVVFIEGRNIDTLGALRMRLIEAGWELAEVPPTAQGGRTTVTAWSPEHELITIPVEIA